MVLSMTESVSQVQHIVNKVHILRGDSYQTSSWASDHILREIQACPTSSQDQSHFAAACEELESKAFAHACLSTRYRHHLCCAQPWRAMSEF